MRQSCIEFAQEWSEKWIEDDDFRPFERRLLTVIAGLAGYDGRELRYEGMVGKQWFADLYSLAWNGSQDYLLPMEARQAVKSSGVKALARVSLHGYLNSLQRKGWIKIIRDAKTGNHIAIRPAFPPILVPMTYGPLDGKTATLTKAPEDGEELEFTSWRLVTDRYHYRADEGVLVHGPYRDDQDDTDHGAVPTPQFPAFTS